MDKKNLTPNARFTHFGFWVSDLAKMAGFYQRLFKMHRSDEGRIDGHDLKAELIFLTRDPMVHHQIVLIGGKPDGIPFNVINQISFLVGSLSDLRTFWNILTDEKQLFVGDQGLALLGEFEIDTEENSSLIHHYSYDEACLQLNF